MTPGCLSLLIQLDNAFQTLANVSMFAASERTPWLDAIEVIVIGEGVESCVMVSQSELHFTFTHKLEQRLRQG